jgi:segregation and condensation protein B
MNEHDSPTVDENDVENDTLDAVQEPETAPVNNAEASADEDSEIASDAIDADSMADDESVGEEGQEEGQIEKHVDVVLVKRVLEGAILAADAPLDRDAMLVLFDENERPDKTALNEILTLLAEDYTGRGIELREVASGFRFQVRKEVGPWVSRLWQEKPARYSRAILETLALIAYRQPITRGEIEEIRGVSVNTQIIRTLLERNWVRVVGHRDVPGRPAMFATTRQFLDYFDLTSLEDLPPLSEIKDLDKMNEELQLEQEKVAAEAAAALAATLNERSEESPVDESGQTSILDKIHDDPEIDESTLMSLDKVDSVLAGFEAEFRKKPVVQDAEEDDTPSREATTSSDADLFEEAIASEDDDAEQEDSASLALEEELDEDQDGSKHE